MLAAASGQSGKMRRKFDEFDRYSKTERKVGKARIVPDRFQERPQEWLESSKHPNAPFTGDTLKWSSFAYHDASTCDLCCVLDLKLSGFGA